MIILDERGERWSVEKDDPLGVALGRLVRQGFQQASIVVPQGVLLGGVVPDYIVPPAKPWKGDDFLRYCNLADTCARLRNVV